MTLKENQHSLLLEILEKRNPDLVARYSHADRSVPNSEELEMTLDALADELVATGLDDQFEPTGRGHLIEALIDEISAELRR